MKPDLARRLPRALLVTGVALLVFGSTAAIAGGDGPVPTDLGVTEPHDGDAWTYDVQGQVRRIDGVRGFAYSIHNERTGPTAWQDADGAWRTSDRLVSQWDHPVYFHRQEHMLDEDGTAVAVRILANSTSKGTFSTGGIGPIDPTPDTVTDLEHFSDGLYYQSSDEPCGYKSRLQGTHLDAGDPVRVLGACEATYRFDGVETVSGLETMRYVHHEAADDGRHDTTLWFAPHVPYPVQVHEVVDDGDGDPVPRYERTLRMTGFQAGTAERPAPPLRPDEQVPAAELAPRPAWGIDDAGIDHPFPLSEAWRAALDDPEFPLRDYLRQHPDAAVVSAGHTTTRTDEGLERRWGILLSDETGDHASQIFATLPPQDDPAPTDPDPASALGGLLGQDPGVRLVWYGDVGVSGFAPPSRIPERLPTVASLVDAWTALSDDDRFDAYGFTYSCRDPCDEVLVRIDVGREVRDDVQWDSLDQVTGVDEPVRGSGAFLRVGADGIPVLLETHETNGRTHSEGLAALPAEAGPAQDPDAESIPMQASVLGVPASRVAGVTAAAFLVGALYWLWPALKSGGLVGLFSRLRRDELLDHPVRAAIHNAIQAEPGIHYHGLVRVTGKGHGTVDHHLRKLQDGGLVVSHRNAGRTCFFVRGAMDHEVMQAVPVVRSEAALRVLAAVLRNPGVSSTAVADELGVGKSTISHHVRRLRDAGLLRDGAGGLFATDVGGRAARAVAA